jgi:hypothetical protein
MPSSWVPSVFTKSPIGSKGEEIGEIRFPVAAEESQDVTGISTE